MVIKSNFLPAAVQLHPKFNTFRKVILFNTIEESTEVLQSDTEISPDCFITFDSLPIKDKSNTSIDEFMKATHKLILDYNKPYHISLQSFIEYCSRFGSIFRDVTETQAYMAMNITSALINLGGVLWLINIFSHDKIHQLCKAIATVIESNSDQEEIYINIAHQNSVKSQKEINAKLIKQIDDHDIASKIRNSSDKKYHLFPNLLPNLGIIVGKLIIEGYHKDLPESLKIPPLSLHFISKDLKILKHGTTAQKDLLLKHKLLEVMSPLIKFQSPKLVFDADKPAIHSLVEDPLSVFLLKMIIDTQSFNTCLYCGELTAAGQKYCNLDHKEKYRRSTPRGRLDNLLRQWQCGSKEIIKSTEITPFYEYGIEQIDAGKDYKSEILPELKKMKKLLITNRRVNDQATKN